MLSYRAALSGLEPRVGQKRQVGERVGESEGRRRKRGASERSATSHANGARRRSAERESV